MWIDGQWHLTNASKGLMEWLKNMEDEKPNVWSDAAVAGGQINIRGKQHAYRIVPGESNDVPLIIQRKMK